MDGMGRWGWRDLAPGLAVGLVLAGFVALHAAGRQGVSDTLLWGWGVKPFRFPFVDADTVMSALRCLRRGVDVFESNPCDALDRVYDYSPLWLHLAVFPFTEAWIVPVGLGVDVAFVLSLFLLPAGRWWGGTGLMLLAVLSPSVAFALERANNDLVIFVLGVLAARLVLRGKALRALGYGCAFLAGLLKYYPMMLMALALRERPARFVAIALLSLAGLGLFVALEYGPLVRALALIPVGSPFGDMFGARTLPLGLTHLARLAPSRAGPAEIVLDLLAVGVGAGLAWRGVIADDLARLGPLERTTLIAGVLLILACFVTAQNIGYRAVHLVLAVPALAVLAGGAGERRLWGWTLAIVLGLLWSQGWRHWLDALMEQQSPWGAVAWTRFDAARMAGWALREVAWWWVVTLFWAVLFAWLSRSAAVLGMSAGFLARPRFTRGSRPASPVPAGRPPLPRSGP